MELPKITGFLWFYLGLLLAFGQILTVQGQGNGGEWELPAEPALAADGLQIKLDRDLYKKQGSIVYASHLHFDETPDISDSQLYKIARDAYNEMRSSATKNGLTEKIPNVMTTLLIGNELIFASSAKGPKDPYDPEDQVVGDLTVCSNANEGRRHKNGGRCGEVMAFHEWYQTHEGSSRLNADSGAKVVAISMQKNPAGKREPLILAPCGNDKEWGCNVFINGVYALDNAKVAADPRTQAFRYKNMIKEKKLKPAPPKPAQPLPPPNKLPPPPSRPNERPSGSKPGPPPNKLPPPPGRPNPAPGGSLSSPENTGKPPKNPKNPRPPKGPGKPKRP
ncbi:hypothetical protein ISF_00082 [Cordyceps fumosorosea ARSEF 2679]|uniref:Uncharacterized protein n=1 Tax=Cordyceps fumosorosea (strain ARSEF 2679) TaxID=1081104 RepID=A0A168DZB1_CORFA|nr:hypothetical protein ISF_00082 [Cordyceps fumosorosea ARSEF 2679]OAA73181.1 hypothetical protein ISF_00082 [Cordyceps fumosorosea ARSEF 2679]